jgi:CRP/FNR family transcriptional regulator, cyclic AMP receptor protein
MSQLTMLLPSTGILAPLSEEARARLAVAGEFRTLKIGATLAQQGEPQHHLHILLTGQLRATIHAPGRVIELGAIQPGESVGEMNVIDPRKASADVSAVEPSELWSITKESLDAFMAEDLADGFILMKALATELCRRLRRSSDQMLRQAETYRAHCEWMD